MERFTRIYIKISALIYCTVFLIAGLVWFTARFVFGIVPAFIPALLEVHQAVLIMLGIVIGVVLIQLTAWIISHILHRVTSVRG